MAVEAKCKFCGKPIHLTIDEDYAKLGDPMKVIKLAACNRCADNREEARRLHGLLHEVCCQLFAFPKDEDLRKAIRVSLERITKEYVRMINDRLDCESVLWSEGIVNEFMVSPRYWPRHVKELWRMARQQKLAL